MARDAETTPIRRGHFEAKSTPGRWFQDGELEATAGEHGIALAITDEAAFGSHNSEVTATALLSREDALRFRDWLSEVLA